jgi:hypothetical protein
MDIIINVRTLAIEVTRRCNQNCAHCMRGKAQKLDTLPDIIWSAVTTFDEIDTIAPTGGEPFLVPDLTALAINASNARDCFISTNGSVSPFSERGKKIMAAFGSTCEETSEIRISNDRFHDGYHKGWVRLLYGYPGDGCRIYAEDILDRFPGAIIDRGKARENGLGQSGEIKRFVFQTLSDAESFTVDIEHIYIDAKGRTFFDCNLSYEMMDEIAKKGDPKYYGGPVCDLRENLESRFDEICKGCA